jgi:hypothetical protein
MDKYELKEVDNYFLLHEEGNSSPIAKIYCTHEIANLLDKSLNQTSRAGQVKSQAKRDAAKRNIAKRWSKT